MHMVQIQRYKAARQSKVYSMPYKTAVVKPSQQGKHEQAWQANYKCINQTECQTELQNCQSKVHNEKIWKQSTQCRKYGNKVHNAER